MSAKPPRLGVAHPTVVPGNHPGESDADDDASDADESAGADQSAESQL